MILGIDIGTTAVKAVLLEENARVLDSVEVAHEVQCPHPGWAEERPEDWWNGCVKATQLLTARCGNAITMIGVSGMVPALVLLGKDGQPLRPSIQQNDVRATKELEWFREHYPEDALFERTGATWNLQLLAPKLRWLRQYEPERWSRLERVCGSYEYLTWKLSGAVYSELNWALESGLWDVTRGAWCEDLLESLDLPTQALAPVRQPHEVVGTVTLEAARLTGLRTGTPVIAGSADHIAAALSAGLANPGDAVVKLGGAGDFLYAVSGFAPIRELFVDFHLLPGLCVLNGCMATSGALLRWFQHAFGAGADLQTLDQQAAQIPAGSQGLLTLPYFLGEKTPLHDPFARGTVLGLTLSHTPAHLYRSLLEGVAYAFRHHLEVLEKHGHRVHKIYVVDGGAKSVLWRSILASVLGQDMIYLNTSDRGSAYGVAFLAGSVAGYWPLESIGIYLSEVERTPPERGDVETYARMYLLFRATYLALKPLYPALLEVVSAGPKAEHP